MSEFDVFISYNWDVKPAVKNLYNELTNKHNLRVWMDEYELGQNRLVDELSKSIAKSKVFLCCITRKYAESENCKDEIDYAKNLKKKMIVLMFERVDMQDLGGVGFIIGPKVRYNCYKSPEMFNNWSSNEMFTSIVNSIKGTDGTEKDTLCLNHTLDSEVMLVSRNKDYFALVQNDGNLVLYENQQKSFNRDKPIWASNTWNSSNPKPFKLKITNDGNLILADKNNGTVWSSKTENKGEPGDFILIVQNDGNLVLYDKNMNATWATNTHKR